MSAQYDQIIYNIAIENGFNPKAAKLVVAQARLESADYTSSVFRNNLNTSGMKYIGQPLATRGTLAPLSERSKACKDTGACRDSDYYAKFNSVEDSAKDKIERNYKIAINGIAPEYLKSAVTPESFAEILKKRSYYGFHKWDTEEGKKEANKYAAALSSKLKRIAVVEMYEDNKGAIWTIIGVGLVGVALYLYYNKKALNQLTNKL
jgi:hypothetical protein